MSETFEEWFKEDGNGDFNYFSRDYYAGQWAPLIKHTWNHQQKKIDAKDTEIERLVKRVRELAGINNGHIDIINTKDARIKELEGEVRNIIEGKDNG